MGKTMGKITRTAVIIIILIAILGFTKNHNATKSVEWQEEQITNAQDQGNATYTIIPAQKKMAEENWATEEQNVIVKLSTSTNDELERKPYEQETIEQEATKQEVIEQETITLQVQGLAKMQKKATQQATVESNTDDQTADTQANMIVPENIAQYIEGIEPIVRTFNTSAYCLSGKTASGEYTTTWHTIASGSSYPFGTIIYIPYFADEPNGGWFVVEDRGGAITDAHLDVYMTIYDDCIQFGRRDLECYVYFLQI